MSKRRIWASRLPRSVSMFVVATFLAGCASMKVQVSVLDPEVIEAEEDRSFLRSTLPVALAQTEEEVSRDLRAVEEAHRQMYEVFASAYEERADQLANADDSAFLDSLASYLRKDFDDEVVPLYDRAIETIVGLNADIRTASAKLDSVPNQQDSIAVTDVLLGLLRERRGVRDGLLRVVERDVPELDPAAASQLRDSLLAILEKGIEKKEERDQVLSESILRGEPVTESPFAHAISSAPDSSWSEKFNEVVGKAVFGNVDIAVKVDPSGEFTLKGLTFDPSDVVRAVSTASVQALMLTAQIAGVPVSTKAGDKPRSGDALAGASSGIALTRDSEALRQARLRAFNDALLTIASAIVSEASSLRADDAERAEAIQAIRQTYDAHKSRLEVNPAQSGVPKDAGGTPSESDSDSESNDR